MLGSLLLVLILTLLNFAFMPMDEETDYDLFIMEGGIVTSVVDDFFRNSSLSGFAIGVIAMTLISEYLRSHIGEKRPADQMIVSSQLASHAIFKDDSVFQSRLFFFSTLVQEHWNGLFASFMRDRFPRFRPKKIFFKGGL